MILLVKDSSIFLSRGLVTLILFLTPFVTSAFLIQEYKPTLGGINYGLSGSSVALTAYGSYATGTLGYIKKYARYIGPGSLSTTTLRLRLSSGTLGDRNCYTPTKSLADWGITSSYPSFPISFTEFSGAQCSITSGNYSVKVLTNLAPTGNFQIRGGSSDGWFQSYTGVPYNLITSNITATTTWSSADPYVISGNLSINSGVTLTIDPGVVVKFDTATSSSLIVNGNLVAEGSEVNAYTYRHIYFTSLNDDAVPAIGDTNNNGSTTIPAAGDWGGIVVNSGGVANLKYATVRYGGATSSSNSLVHNNGGIISIASSTIAHGTFYGVLNTTGTTTITSADVGFNDYGLYKDGGYMSIGASSTVHDNSEYGIFNDTVNSINAENVWWATSTGPKHYINNPSGVSDEVSDNVDYFPWVTDIHYYYGDCFSIGLCGSTPTTTRTLLWEWASSTTPVYTDLLDNAIGVWNSEGVVDIVSATSTVNLTIYATSTDDMPWSGQWYSGINKIDFNTYYLNVYTDDQIQHTMTHELGHAVGLRHSYTGNVMYHNQTSLTTLGIQDRLDLHTLWQ